MPYRNPKDAKKIKEANLNEVRSALIGGKQVRASTLAGKMKDARSGHYYGGWYVSDMLSTVSRMITQLRSDGAIILQEGSGGDRTYIMKAYLDEGGSIVQCSESTAPPPAPKAAPEPVAYEVNVSVRCGGGDVGRVFASSGGVIRFSPSPHAAFSIKDMKKIVSIMSTADSLPK